MNATDTKMLRDYAREDLQQTTKRMQELAAGCTHVYADGTTAIVKKRDFTYPHYLETFTMCVGCEQFVERDLPNDVSVPMVRP